MQGGDMQASEASEASVASIIVSFGEPKVWWMKPESVAKGRMPGTVDKIPSRLWKAMAPWMHSKKQWYFRASPPLPAFYCIKPQAIRPGQTFGKNGFLARKAGIAWSGVATFADPFVAALCLAAASVDPRLRTRKKVLRDWLSAMCEDDSSSSRWLEDPVVVQGMSSAPRCVSLKCQLAGCKAKEKTTVSHELVSEMAQASKCSIERVLASMKEHNGDVSLSRRDLAL